MRRRDYLKLSGAAALLASGFPAEAADVVDAAQLQDEVIRLQLKHTWTTVMSSSTFRDTLQVQYGRDGMIGYGEGALMDWNGKKLGVPLYRYFGLDPKDAPVTTFSIGIDNPATTKAKVEEAAQFPVLKIKVGLDSDEATIAAVRAVTKKPLRVDANEGWTDKEVAVRKINWLETQGVEFIEQPMPADRIEDTRWVRSRVHIPIIADESCLHARDIPKVKDAFDGINVKLDKAGGMLEAYRMIQIAKSC